MINEPPTGTCMSIISASRCDNAKCQQGKKRVFQTKDQDTWLQGTRLGFLEEESIPQFYLYSLNHHSLPGLPPFVKQEHCHTSANCSEVSRSAMFKSNATFSDAGQTSHGPGQFGRALSLDFFQFLQHCGPLAMLGPAKLRECRSTAQKKR